MTEDVHTADDPKPEPITVSRTPSLTQDIKAGLMGVGIAVLCLIPPGIHFVSGPLGPAIGGFFAAARIRARGQHALAVGLTIGVGEAIAALIIAAGLVAFKVVSADSSSIVFVAAIDVLVFLYSTTLGTIGAFIGGGGGS
jgi:hypothetical protein